MTALTRRFATLLAVLMLAVAGVQFAALPAQAQTTVDAAASAFGLGRYDVVSVTGHGDITAELTQAVAGATPRVVYLPGGNFALRRTVRIPSNVYLVAESTTKVTWAGKDSTMLLFAATSAAGVYGGTWDGAYAGSSTVFTANGAHVSLIGLTVTRAAKYDIGGYGGSAVTLTTVTTSRAKADGVHLQGSTLTASGLRSTKNRRGGVQLSAGSRATITGSALDGNGLAVSGSTSGKTGHGLGVAASTATVSATSMSKNKVCGLSISGGGTVGVANSHLDANRRHGVGTTAGAKVTVTGSTVNANGYDGVLASGSGTSITVTNSSIVAAKQYGVSVVSAGQVTLSGTLVQKAGKIAVAASGKAKVTLADANTISGARSHGIAVAGKARLTVSGDGNQVTGNAGNGLLLSDSGSSGTISRSVHFDGNRTNAILVRAKARLSMVACWFTSTRGKSIAVQTGGKVTSLT